MKNLPRRTVRLFLFAMIASLGACHFHGCGYGFHGPHGHYHCR